MTIVAGIETESCAWVGADTQSTKGNLDQFETDKDVPKVFKAKDDESAVFAVSGYKRIGQLIMVREDLTHKADNTMHGVVDKIIPRIRKTLKKHGAQWKKKNSKVEDRYYGSMIFGYEDSVYEIQSNYQVIKDDEDFQTAGSGYSHAQNVLQSTQGSGLDPEHRLIKAIYRSCQNNAGCSMPMHLRSTGGDTMYVTEEDLEDYDFIEA